VSRVCGDCSECCKGAVSGTVRGHEFYPGRPCFFFGNGCTIYPDRPPLCSEYRCAWLQDESIPEWFKPSLAKIVISRRMEGTIEVYDMSECGVKVDSTVLSFLIIWALNNKKNLRYRVDGGINRIGSPEFLAT
jgi:hypothetical protein